MCNFFSLLSDGKGKLYYFDAAARAVLRKKNPHNYKPDSHTSIAHMCGFKAAEEDKLNKWEYNPLTQKLMADFINTTNDKTKVLSALETLDFTTIEPEIIIKPIINPFKVKRSGPVTEHEKKLLKEWASVRNSVWNSVGSSVRDSVWDSVGDSVWASVRDSVWDSVRNSVWNSVGSSVRDSVWAYIGSFFRFSLQNYKFQCAVDLWEAGLVPSFDRKTWRLHHGKQIVYETEFK